MVSKCANSDCGARFQYLREGKVFKFEVGRNFKNDATSEPRLITVKKPSAKIEHFWLCGKCAPNMTLRYEHSKGVVVIPVKQTAQRAAAS